MAGTGNGATVALSVSTVSTCITSVELPNFAVEDLETSCLNTTNFKTFQASDLTDAGEITVNFLFNQDSDTLLARGVAEVITITWPIHTSGNTTNATFVADGYIRNCLRCRMANCRRHLLSSSLTAKIRSQLSQQKQHNES
jgi:hypothetical protein